MAGMLAEEVFEMIREEYGGTGEEFGGTGEEFGGKGGGRGERHAFRRFSSPHGMRPGSFREGMFSEMRGLVPGSFGYLLRPAVLLLLAEEPMHGYELAGRLKELGVGRAGMDPSLVYRVLRMLEGAGMARSALDDTGTGPARKVYSLTPEGMEVLDLWAANLEEVLGLLKELRERYQNLVSRNKRDKRG